MSPKKALKAFGRKKYLAAAIPLIMAAQAQGIEFYAGGVEANLDSKFSIGQSWRLEDMAKDDNNEDNGNLRYQDGDSFSQIFKGNHDLQVTYENYGAFVRGKYWYDAELENDDTIQSDANNHELAKYSGAAILDAFVYADFEVADMPVDVRLGKQVLSWGESTFFSGGVSSVNPYDVSSFRRPGSELKEGLIPVNMAFTNVGITENFSAEAFYLLEFRETVTEACETYWADNDYQGAGCMDIDVDELGFIQRDDFDNRKPSSDGQFGLAFRYIAEELDTEFGFYAMNVHGNLPLVSGRKAAINEAQVLALVQGGYDDALFSAGGSFEGLTAAGINSLDELAASIAGGDPYEQADNYAATLTSLHGDALELSAAMTSNGDIESLTQLDDGFGGAFTAGTVSNGATGFDIAERNSFFTEYGEDIQIYGLSFATNVGGVAVSGEISHKVDVPLQMQDKQVIIGSFVADYYVDILGIGGDDEMLNYLAGLEDGEDSHSYVLHDVTQAQITAIQLFDQVLGADRYAFVAEIGLNKIHGLDTSDNAIKFGGTQTNTEAGLDYFALTYEDTATEYSWGYTTRLNAKYNDVFSGVSLSHTLAYTKDVRGNSPDPGGNFNEGDESFGVNLTADYQNTYTASLAYKTSNWDRDFASLSIGMTY